MLISALQLFSPERALIQFSKRWSWEILSLRPSISHLVLHASTVLRSKDRKYNLFFLIPLCHRESSSANPHARPFHWKLCLGDLSHWAIFPEPWAINATSLHSSGSPTAIPDTDIHKHTYSKEFTLLSLDAYEKRQIVKRSQQWS